MSGETGREEFVSEAMTVTTVGSDASAMARGEPALPDAFTWRGGEYRITGLLDKWKSSGPCRSGSKEMYLRKHWYKVLTDPPTVMTIYCDRQVRSTRRPKARWWIYTVEAAGGEEAASDRQAGRKGEGYPCG